MGEMQMNNTIFSPGNEAYGYDGDRFVFANWSEAWKAVCTPRHMLAEHAAYILSKRPSVQVGRFEYLCISFDAARPIVETIYSRWLGWSVVFSFCLVFWIALFSAL